VYHKPAPEKWTRFSAPVCGACVMDIKKSATASYAPQWLTVFASCDAMNRILLGHNTA